MTGEDKFQSYQDLLVWQKGMILAENCYSETKKFPRDEMFGLTSQIRRAATSIPANIAEGHGREKSGNFIHHLRISQGSLKELETHLILSQRVGHMEQSTAAALLDQCQEIGKMVRGLIRSIQLIKSEQ